MAKAQPATYAVKQEANFREPNTWQWGVWIEGTKKDLNAIKKVVYLLDPSFSDNPREVTDRQTNFRLEEESSRGFTIAIQVELKTGKKIRMQHELVLDRPVVPLKMAATYKNKAPHTIRLRGIRQPNTGLHDADNTVMELRESYHLGDATRSLRESH